MRFPGLGATRGPAMEGHCTGFLRGSWPWRKLWRFRITQEIPMKLVVSVVEYSTYPRGPRSGPGYSVPVRHHLIGPDANDPELTSVPQPSCRLRSIKLEPAARELTVAPAAALHPARSGQDRAP